MFMMERQYCKDVYFLQIIYRVNVIPIKIPASFFSWKVKRILVLKNTR